MSETGQDPKERKPDCFDAKVVNEYVALTHRVLQGCPELRSVAVVLDYQGELNEVAKSGVFVTRSGGYQDPKELLGGLEQTARMMAKQMEASIGLIGHLARQNNDLNNQYRAAKQEIENLLEQRKQLLAKQAAEESGSEGEN